MTNELFSRLTDARPAPLTAPAGIGRYTYTPRKALRRVLDHALDHLNQIDQWLAWQRHGVVPTPTDGWVPSTVTLPDDRLPLAPADLDAWLWRIDQAARLVVRRAAELSEVELDCSTRWGWPLRACSITSPLGATLRGPLDERARRRSVAPVRGAAALDDGGARRRRGEAER